MRLSVTQDPDSTAMKSSSFKPLVAAAATLLVVGVASPAKAASRDLDRDGIPNALDPDIDNDGIPNSTDTNVDGGLCKSGPLRGRYIGDRLLNDNAAEKDIDDDGKNDDAADELDIDGDRRADDSPSESDIDGDLRADDSSKESDIDGDGRTDDSPDELDIDGDGRNDDDPSEDDTDGDSRRDGLEDGDDDGDGLNDDLDDDDDGDGHQGRNRGGDDDDEADDDNSGPGLPGGQVGDGNAPVALSGVTYLVSENGTQLPERVEFLTASTGRVVDGADIDGFTYTFTPSSTTATVRLQFKSDKWDIYTLNFATGNFSRVEFDKNVQKDTDVGTFALPQ